MKSLLIKIGKAYQLIRKDGFINGTKKTLGYLRVFLKAMFVKSGDVLIITSGVGDSALYRADHIAEELNLHQIRCTKTVIDNPFLLKYADKFKVFIFHRPSFSEKIKKLVEKIKIQNKEIIFETDDLVFDAELFKQTDVYKSMNSLQRMQYEKGIGIELIDDSYVKVCTTTTSFLAKKLEKYNKKVFIVSNKLSQKDLKICDEILKNPKRKDGKIRLGYFSGTSSHNKDFATITEALEKIMEKYPQIELFLVGPLDTKNKLNIFKERIKQFPYVPREKHFANIYSVDINLAPLVLNDPFCAAKSELKFFEAGILKVPTVAVRNQTFSEAITDGINGFLADKTEEWVEKLSRLIESESLRQEMGERAREKALKDHTTKNSHDEEYYGYLRKRIEEIK
jgi:glycosyltransferase involved in cell wall biosynthesis